MQQVVSGTIVDALFDAPSSTRCSAARGAAMVSIAWMHRHGACAATVGEASIKGPQTGGAHGYTPGYMGVYLVRVLPPYAPI